MVSLQCLNGAERFPLTLLLSRGAPPGGVPSLGPSVAISSCPMPPELADGCVTSSARFCRKLYDPPSVHPLMMAFFCVVCDRSRCLKSDILRQLITFLNYPLFRSANNRTVRNGVSLSIHKYAVAFCTLKTGCLATCRFPVDNWC